MTGLSILFRPGVPDGVIITLLLIAAVLAVLTFWKKSNALWRRLLFVACLLLALANPFAVRETRIQASDQVLILTDTSGSMQLNRRDDAVKKAKEGLEQALSAIPRLEFREVDFGSRDRTLLLPALQEQLAQLDETRLGGIFIITDGNIQDAVRDIAALTFKAPVHFLLAGKHDERDRRLIIQQAPGFALAGSRPSVRVLIENEPASVNAAILTIKTADGEATTLTVPVNKPTDVSLPPLKAGANAFQLSVEPWDDEITLRNNQALVTVSGIREALRVLLVSGVPHVGERTWRNLLKADPAVDLIHFTILRSPDKPNMVPNNEMSLVAFPVKELFATELHKFDLVIFDRMMQLSVLPDELLANVAAYVKNGGALLDVAPPGYNSARSLYRSPIAAVLPTAPAGYALEQRFTPAVTETGLRHPVTAGLASWRGNNSGAKPWGDWLRQIPTRQLWGNVLMTGLSGQPLLVAGDQGKGRVAQLLSDQIWLWTRGFDGGGPQADLLRRLAHWLMKEPDLEPESLRGEAKAQADGQGYELTVLRRSLAQNVDQVYVTAPNGQRESVTLAFRPETGFYTGTLNVNDTGLYRLEDSQVQSVVMVGTADGAEWQHMRATDAIIKPIAQSTKGQIVWLQDSEALPTIRATEGRSFNGMGAMDLKRNRASIITGVETAPLLPPWLPLVILLSAAVYVWWREGRR